VIDDILARLSQDDAPVQPPRMPPALTPQTILRSIKPPRTIEPDAVAKNVSQLVAEPDLMMDALSDIGDEMEDISPESAQDLRNTVSRAVFFLASKAPKERPSTPGMPPLPPPKQDVAKFERYLRVVNDPLSIMDDAESGALTPEAVEAVKHVYPQIFATMQADLALRVQNMPSIPYKRRLQISALLGQDMTGMLRPDIAMSAQAAYGQAQQQESAKGQVPLSRASKLNMADRAEYNTAARKEAQRGVGMWNRRG
jgi:hypothetical protein